MTIIYKDYSYKLEQSSQNKISCYLCDLQNKKILDKEPCNRYGAECNKTSPMSYWVKQEKVTNNQKNETDKNGQLSLF